MDKPVLQPRKNQWRADPGTNYVRYRGQNRRGKPKFATVDVKDLELALAELVCAEDALLDFATKHVEVREAMGRIDLAARFIDEVRARRVVSARNKKIGRAHV